MMGLLLRIKLPGDWPGLRKRRNQAEMVLEWPLAACPHDPVLPPSDW